LKAHKLLGKSRLKGELGDRLNIVLAAAVMNLHKIMKALAGNRLSWLDS